MLSLARALFGDFDIDDIMNNSSGYLNAVLFLIYLFVAVFILLSMFLAILGESQAAVRRYQDDEKASGEAPPEYGVFFYSGQALGWAHTRLRTTLGKGAKAEGGEEGEEDDYSAVGSSEGGGGDTDRSQRGNLLTSALVGKAVPLYNRQEHLHVAGVSGVSQRGGGNPTVPSAGTPVAGGSGVSRRGGGNPMAESRAGGLLVDCPRQLTLFVRVRRLTTIRVQPSSMAPAAWKRQAGRRAISGLRVGGGRRRWWAGGHRPTNSPYSCSLHARSR